MKTSTRFPVPALRALAMLSAGGALLLAGCGGGGGAAEAPPTVTGITVDRVSYGQVSTFTATGTNLASGVTPSATGCDGVATTSATATQLVFTCTPNASMSVRVAARSSSAELNSLTRTVPMPRVTMTTSMGTIVVELDPAKVQVTVDNFLAYVRSNFYDGTLMHRIVPNFVVQGGGFTAVAGTTLTQKSGLRSAIALEVNKGLSNVRGSIAMARTSELNSATSQFFINTVNNTSLDTTSGGYAVFGSVVSGMDVVDAMSAVATRTVGTFANVPQTDVVIQTARQTQ